MNDLLKALWDSSSGLYNRFDVYPPDLDAQYRVFHEEIAEFTTELYRGSHEDKEAVDVLVTMLGCLMAVDVTYEDFAAAIQIVIDKNNSKTHQTHKINSNGKIARIES